jgi:thiol-disulfide isomerase/thioredoxin
MRWANPIPRRAVLGCLALGVIFATGAVTFAEEPAGVKLERLNWSQLKERLAKSDARYTLVDAWATTCGPCKENFPHLVEMHHKYHKDGLAVLSLSLDDPADTKAIAAAEQFLKEQRAVFSNVLLDEEYGEGFEKLDINAIPAVFIFGPDGREVKRFTMDDPNNQFTYDQVERTVVRLLRNPRDPDSAK